VLADFRTFISRSLRPRCFGRKAKLLRNGLPMIPFSGPILVVHFFVH
jgi:hypothetical protein